MCFNFKGYFTILGALIRPNYALKPSSILFRFKRCNNLIFLTIGYLWIYYGKSKLLLKNQWTKGNLLQ